MLRGKLTFSAIQGPATASRPWPRPQAQQAAAQREQDRFQQDHHHHRAPPCAQGPHDGDLVPPVVHRVVDAHHDADAGHQHDHHGEHQQHHFDVADDLFEEAGRFPRAGMAAWASLPLVDFGGQGPGLRLLAGADQHGADLLLAVGNRPCSARRRRSSWCWPRSGRSRPLAPASRLSALRRLRYRLRACRRGLRPSGFVLRAGPGPTLPACPPTR